MFRTRLLSGIVLVIVIAFMFYSGGFVLASLLCVISLIGLYEFYKAVNILPDNKKIDSMTLMGYLGCVLVYVLESVFCGDIQYVIIAPVITCVLMLAVYVLTFPKYESKNVVYAFFGFMYVSVLLSFVYLTRMLPEGKLLVWLVLFATWVCDTFAYLTGMAIGKHKLAPVLSPKKSIEGAVGGVVFSAIFAGVYGFFIKDYIVSDLMVMPTFIIACSAGAVVSQIGDLAASAFKRNFEVKDYGHLIPGHGGIMDRFDSMIFTAPMVYIVALVFTNI